MGGWGGKPAGSTSSFWVTVDGSRMTELIVHAIAQMAARLIVMALLVGVVVGGLFIWFVLR